MDTDTNITKKKKITTGLGKGLGALLPPIEYSKEAGFKLKPDGEELPAAGTTALIPISKITFNPYQPRKEFDEQALEDLKNSILEHGVIQAVTVRRTVNGYEVIAGERRVRASQAAGVEKIPAYILDIQDDIGKKLEIALIENLQREDLNPIDTANGYQRLIEECNLTQEQVAIKVSKDRTTITNFLRLLRLPEKIQDSLRTREITTGHARTLLGLSDKEQMILAWQAIIKQGISVRSTEMLVRDIEAGKIKLGADKGKTKAKPRKVVDTTELILEEKASALRHIFGTNVKIIAKTPESGSIELEFYSKDDLERLLDLLNSISFD